MLNLEVVENRQNGDHESRNYEGSKGNVKNVSWIYPIIDKDISNAIKNLDRIRSRQKLSQNPQLIQDFEDFFFEDPDLEH